MVEDHDSVGRSAIVGIDRRVAEHGERVRCFGEQGPVRFIDLYHPRGARVRVHDPAVGGKRAIELLRGSVVLHRELLLTRLLDVLD